MKLTLSTRLTSICFAIVLFVTLSTVTSQCQAQFRRFVPGQELGRYLGAGYGTGYHCRNPGQNTEYYNPYSAHNSQLMSYNDPQGYGGNRYTDFQAATVPHASYNYNGGTNSISGQHSVLDNLPGQTVQPTFEPAKDRTRKQGQEDFDSSLDFDLESDDAGGSGFRDDNVGGSTSRRSTNLQDAIDKLDEALEDQGDFDSLKDTFERLREGASGSDAFGEESLLE